jgi:plasmid segregation protein ParM
MDVLGIDIGFGFTKGSDGSQFTLFKSLYGEAADIQFHMGFTRVPLNSNLHVTIDKQAYFVGEFAEQQSNVRQFTLDQEQLVTDFLKILALTAIGNLTERYTPVNLVSGLPVGYYKHYHAQMKRILAGHHQIDYHMPDGQTLTRRINVNKVKIIPQPIGSVFNILLDDHGKLVDKALARQKLGVVDIGFRTTDFSIFDKLRYIERGSATTDTGISKSFSLIARKLREECGVNVELYRLFDAVKTGFIKIRGKEFNIAKLRDQVFSHAAATIANDLARLWVDDWDMDAILLTGGGSMELAGHLESQIEGQVLPLETSLDARLNNVQGYYRYGRYVWPEKGTGTPAPTEAG